MSEDEYTPTVVRRDRAEQHSATRGDELVAKIADTATADGLDVKVWTTHTGAVSMVAIRPRTGSLLVEVSAVNRGDEVLVTGLVDYGSHGHSWCDGKLYRQAAAATRFVRKFLRTPDA